MKTPITIAFLAAILMAGCSKEPDYSYIPPTPTPLPRPVPPLPDEKTGLVFTVRDDITHTFRFVRYNTLGMGPYTHVDQEFPVGMDAGYPAISRNGEKIVYFIEDSVYVLDIKSAEKTFLYEHASHKLQHAAISTDGSRIAFSASPANEDRADIYVMDAVYGAQVVNLTRNGVNVFSTRPSFNASGTNVVFNTKVGSDQAINYCAVQSGQVFRISDDLVVENEDLFPVYSSEASKIIFSTNRYKNPSSNFDVTELFLAESVPGGENLGYRLTYFTDYWEVGFLVQYPTISSDGNNVYFLGYYQANNTWTILRVNYSDPQGEVWVASHTLPYYQTVFNFTFIETL